MSFIDEYKRLEKLCSDAYGEKHGVSAYIDKMIATRDGPFTVHGWNYDIKMLKHCRWARNRIVHDPGCTEANTCDRGDEEWLDEFYKRMLTGNDPLALYRKAKAPKPKPIPVSYKKEQPSHEPYAPGGCMTLIILAAVMAMAVAFIIFV